MSSFNDIATNLDQRLTALENYFDSLKAKGCPRATCGFVMPEMVVTGIKPYDQYASLQILDIIGYTISFNSFNASGGIGTLQSVQFQSEQHTGDGNSWVTSSEMEMRNNLACSTDIHSSMFVNFVYITYNNIDFHVKARWKTQEYGWSEWSQERKFRYFANGTCTEIS